MKITIISLDKWGYNNFIAEELIKKGHEVTHIDFFKFKYEYPNFLAKIGNFFLKTLFNYNLKREHLNKKLSTLLESKDKQDAILIIKGDNLSVKTLKKIKKKTDTLIAFLNDSTSRYPRMKKVYPYFDKVYSFDPDDVRNFNLSLITNYIYFDYKTVKNDNIEYDVFNIGTLGKRVNIIPNLAEYFKKNNLNFKLIAYSKEHNPILDNTLIEQTTKMLDLDRVFTFVLKSKVLLDIQRPKQKGLSFRVFEALGLNKKIITTNQDIVNYDFYNPNNIFVIKDINEIKIPITFFNSPYQKVNSEIVKSYHISSWVNTVFNLENK